jgi:hypothetical protein
VVVDVVSFVTFGGGALVVVVVSVTFGWGVTVVVVVSVCCTWGSAGVTVVSVVCVVGVGAVAARCCVHVVLLLCAWAGGFWVVVVVLDCVVLCAITGRDRASTTSEPRTKANSFLDIIEFSLLHWSTSMVWVRRNISWAQLLAG